MGKSDTTYGSKARKNFLTFFFFGLIVSLRKGDLSMKDFMYFGIGLAGLSIGVFLGIMDLGLLAYVGLI